ncbi:MAG: hypothetical protein CMP74_02880 [Flavobacteriales bacterium]|nr:hypothetical protein [Flavobacteriales bacterium]|tara:strand:+ start:558 stop:1064 length:507 start_codon:yes stop_codon:yes gene_type:complete
MDEKHYNWNVSYSTKLPISSSELWSIISSPKNLENFHPFCNKNKIFKWPGLGSLDEIHYYNGHIYKRNFVKWINNVGYDLFIKQEKYNQSFVKWRIKQSGNYSILTISIFPYIFNTNSKWLNFFPFFFFVKPNLNNYLKNISKGLIYYIKENKKVTKNQFGNHSWFSN